MNEIAIISSWLKAFAMASIMFFALKLLGFSPTASLLAAFVPFLLGGLNVMTSTVYAATAVAFILCVLSVLFPDLIPFVQKVTGEAFLELGDTNLDKNEGDGASK